MRTIARAIARPCHTSSSETEPDGLSASAGTSRPCGEGTLARETEPDGLSASAGTSRPCGEGTLARETEPRVDGATWCAPTVIPRPTTAVILAAGNGSRMRGEVPKPLMPILGMRLVERAILSLAAAGVDRFVVVTGASGDEVAAGLRAARRLRELDVEVVYCEDWARGNGHSLACGASAAHGPFYLAMADHVFDPAIVRRLGDAAVEQPEDVHLATDACIPGVYDLDDATKVRADATDVITDIGKQLAEFDRVDVGVFACPASLAAVSAAVVRAGGASVSDVMKEMIARRQMRAVPVDGLLWQDVDTPDMRAEAIRRLLASAKKSTDGPVSRWLNRPVSLALTRVLLPLHVTPNQITTVVFALGIIAALLIAHGTATRSWWELAAAAVLTQLASVLDGCDGEIARIALRGSQFGAWYDTLTDNLRYTAMVVASAAGLYARDDAAGYLIAGAAFLAGAIYLVWMMTAHLRRTGAAGTHLVVVRAVEEDARNRTGVFRVLFALRSIVKQDVLALVAALLLVLGLPELALVLGLGCVAAMIVVVDRTLLRAGGAGARFVFGVVGVSLFAWLVSRAPMREIGMTLATVDATVVIAIPIVLAWMLVNSLALRALLGNRVGLWTLLHQRIIGDGYNAIVPAAGLGGEPVRIAMLRRHLTTADAATAIVADRALHLAAGLLVSAAGLLAALAALPLPSVAAAGIPVYVIAALSGATLLVVLVHGDLSGRLVRRLGVWLGAAPGEAPGIRISGRAIAIAVLWNSLGRVVAGAEIALYAVVLGLDLSLIEIVFVTAVLHAVGVALFVVPQGIGVAEAATVLAAQALGLPAAAGLSLGLLRRARILLLSAVGVLLHLGHRARASRTP